MIIAISLVVNFFSLNPCCNGCCSRRLLWMCHTAWEDNVSILVVMDVALAGRKISSAGTLAPVSILVVMDVALAEVLY